MPERDRVVLSPGVSGWGAVNEVTAFLVELAALAILAPWGHSLAAGVAGVLLAAVVLPWAAPVVTNAVLAEIFRRRRPR